MGGRVSLWIDGERITADRAVFWTAVEAVESDPLADPEAFLRTLRDLRADRVEE